MGRRKASERREPVFDVDAGARSRLGRARSTDGATARRSLAPAASAKRRRRKGRPRRADRLSAASPIGARSSALWLVIAAIGGVVWVGAHLPPIQSLEIPKRPPSIQIVDLNGRLLATRGDMGGAAVPLKELPRYVPQAFIAIEDRRFYSHYGIDPFGIARALVANILRRGVSQGGSTLTQQLAKNLFLTQERTLTRKVQEVVLALWLERKFTKAEILDLYLNRVYFGAGAYGIEAAAQRYFGKPAQKLTVAEAAMLAGLVQSPSRLAPTPQSATAPSAAPRSCSPPWWSMSFITDDAAKIALIAAGARACKAAGARLGRTTSPTG